MAPRGEGLISVDVDAKGNKKVCVYDDRTVDSRGILFGENPFDFVLPVTLFQVFSVVLVSQLIYFVTRPIRTPRFISLALAGIIVGPSFLGQNKVIRDHVYLPRQADALTVAALVGAIYSIFIVSLKMDILLTLRSAKRTWKFGLIPYLLSFFVTFGLLHIYRVPGLESPRDRFLLCANVSFSNFPVISQALLDLNLITSELGQIALSSAMVNDIFHWVFIIVMYLLLNILQPGGRHSVLLISFSIFAFMFSCVFIIRPAMLMIARRTPAGKPVRKTYVILILLCVLVMAFISDFIGISFLYGPLFFGLIMPNGPPLGTTVLEKSEVLVNEFFLPLAWAYFGLKINVFGMWNWGFLVKINFAVVTGYLAKLLGCIIISLTYKIRLKHGLVLGLILNMKGIVEFIIYSRLRKIQLLDNQVYHYLALSTLATSMILHPFVELLYKPHTRLDTHSRHHPQIRLIQNTYKNPEFRIICCIHNEGNVRSMISLIEACNPVLSSAICAYVVHLIELQGKSTPVLLPVDMQRRRLSSFNYPITNHIMRAFDNYATSSDGHITVLPYINVSPYKHMHEAVCNLAQDKLVSFLILPFHENDHTRGTQLTASIRDLNANFHAYAPCTVGILVDRYSQLSINRSASEPCFHVGIFFVSGPDDREALALGNRMSERVNIRVTLFRFIVKKEEDSGVNEKKVDETEMLDRTYSEKSEVEERILDEGSVDEFMTKNIGNRNVVWKEIVVEDGIRVLEAIRGLEGNYDLVMVGRRHIMEGLDDKEMSNFMENVEMLGIIGDMLASTEFCNGMVPVLVMRCGMRPENNFARLESIAISHKRFF